MGMTYDDTELQRVLELLDVKGRKEAWRSACRRTGGKVRKAARSNLRGSGLHNASKMQRAVRLVVLRKDAGFRVTVASSRQRKRGMYRNRRGKELPVPRWAETGTGERHTKDRRHTLRGKVRRWLNGRNEAPRGRMRRYGFMERTLQQVRGWVGDDLRDELVEAVFRVATKRGLT